MTISCDNGFRRESCARQFGDDKLGERRLRSRGGAGVAGYGEGQEIEKDSQPDASTTTMVSTMPLRIPDVIFDSDFFGEALLEPEYQKKEGSNGDRI